MTEKKRLNYLKSQAELDVFQTMKCLFSRVSFYNIYNFFDKFEESKIENEMLKKRVGMLEERLKSPSSQTWRQGSVAKA